MATRRTHTSVDASENYLYIAPPVSRGLIGLHLFGVDAERSLDNRSRDGVQGGAVTGAPTYAPGFVTTKAQTNYLNLPEVEPASFTVMVVASSGDTHAALATIPAFISSNLSSGAAGGLEIRANTGGSAASANLTASVNIINGGTRSSVTRTMAAVDMTRARLLCISYDAATRVFSFDDLTANTSFPTTAAVGATREANALPIRVGSSHVSTVQGVGNVSLAAIHNVALTAEEKAANYAFYKRLLQDKRGVAI